MAGVNSRTDETNRLSHLRKCMKDNGSVGYQSTRASKLYREPVKKVTPFIPFEPAVDMNAREDSVGQAKLETREVQYPFIGSTVSQIRVAYKQRGHNNRQQLRLKETTGPAESASTSPFDVIAPAAAVLDVEYSRWCADPAQRLAWIGSARQTLRSGLPVVVRSAADPSDPEGDRSGRLALQSLSAEVSESVGSSSKISIWESSSRRFSDLLLEPQRKAKALSAATAVAPFGGLSEVRR